jgi:hypothetical protein
MDHINSIRAALRAKAPVVAVPVEGHAPICVRAKLLKGALKGVTILSVKVLENRWLKVTGVDMNRGGLVHTCSKFAPMDRRIALQEIGEWRRTVFSRLVGMANRLKNVRADIRALTPPADEETDLQIAA